jgi:hypothetical protein
MIDETIDRGRLFGAVSPRMPRLVTKASQCAEPPENLVASRRRVRPLRIGDPPSRKSMIDDDDSRDQRIQEGRHRITAMRDAGVRRTLLVRLELAGPGL